MLHNIPTPAYPAAMDPAPRSNAFLSDDTGKIKYRGSPCYLFLTASRLVVTNPRRSGDRPVAEVSLDSVVGSACKPTSSKRKPNVTHLSVYYYPDVPPGCCGSASDGKSRKRKVLNLEFHIGPVACQSWSNAINTIATTANVPEIYHDDETDRDIYPSPDPRHFMVIVNPVGGQRLGKKIWLRTVEPMLAEAGAEAHLLMTEYANHARDVITETDLSIFYAIVCIGGDGIVYEVINGITSKPGGFDLLRSINLVHIPGGTGNGLAKSVLFGCGEAYSPVNAMFVGLKGKPKGLDLSVVTMLDGTNANTVAAAHASGPSDAHANIAVSEGENDDSVPRISCLMLTWGLIADVDIMSESMRCLGELRLFVAAAYFIGKRKMYTGRLRMKTATSPSAAHKQQQGTIVTNPVASAPEDGGETGITRDRGSSQDLLSGQRSESGTGALTASSTACSGGVDSSIDVEKDGEWLTLEGQFAMVWVVQTSHTSGSVYSGPGVELDDGLFTVFVMQEVSRVALLSLMLDIDTGKHVQHPAITEYKCTEYVLEPLLSETGILDLDGEVIPYKPVHARVLPSAVKVLSL